MAGPLPREVDPPLPHTPHFNAESHIERYANNPIECDHGRLKARLRPMRGLKRQRSALVVVGGHAFVQNLRRGHYELGMEVPANRRVAAAFAEIARAI
jgi:transposase, IS6 family